MESLDKYLEKELKKYKHLDVVYAGGRVDGFTTLEILNLLKDELKIIIQEDKVCLGFCHILRMSKRDGVLTQNEVDKFKSYLQSTLQPGRDYYDYNGNITKSKSKFVWPLYLTKPRMEWLEKQIKYRKSKVEVLKHKFQSRHYKESPIKTIGHIRSFLEVYCGYDFMEVCSVGFSTVMHSGDLIATYQYDSDFPVFCFTKPKFRENQDIFIDEFLKKSYEK